MLSLREIDRLNPSDEDLQLLWDLLLERPTWANISHGGIMPTWDEHVQHVREFRRRGWWVIEDRLDRQEPPFTDAKGAIYLSQNNEIGVAILGSRQNKGYATWAILKLIEMFPGEGLYANTAPGNLASQKLFQGLGFAEIQRTFGLV